MTCEKMVMLRGNETNMSDDLNQVILSKNQTPGIFVVKAKLDNNSNY